MVDINKLGEILERIANSLEVIAEYCRSKMEMKGANIREGNIMNNEVEFPSSELKVANDISKIEDISINITPNPFNGVCRITIPEGYTAAIYDQSGRAVESFSEPQHLWRPLKNLPSGVYFVRAGDGKRTLSRKILYIR